jgi:hypothetical protein
MSSPTEEIDPTTATDDRSSIAKELEQVTDDGYARKPEGEQAPPPEQEPVESETEVVEPETPEVETQPTGDQPPPEVPTEAPPTAPVEDGLDEEEREIEAIQAPANWSPKHKELVNILKDKAKREHKTVKELRQEIQQANAREYLDDAGKKEIEDLRNLRRQVAINQDPEWDARFTQPIRNHEGNALGILKHFNLPEDTEKFITEQGGLIRVRDNDNLKMPPGTTYPPEQPGQAGRPFAGSQADWFKEVLEPMLEATLPAAAKNRLKFHLSKADEISAERDVTLQQARANPQQFFERKKQQTDALIKTLTERADKQLLKEADIYGDIAKEKVLTGKETPEQKTEMLAHNARIDEAKESIKRYLQDQTPENMVSMATARAYRDVYVLKEVPRVQAENEVLRKENAELKARWDNAKNVAQTSRQRATVQQPKERKEVKAYDPGESIKELMEGVPA